MNVTIPDMPEDRSIVLVGLMGAGKSAIGRRLASRIGIRFVDADAQIEAAAGLSIEDIFEVHGEAAFRDGERRVIRRLLSEPPCVIATGGGAWMEEETRRSVSETGVSIWLRADIELLLSRVGRRNNRPLLKTGDKRATLERLIAERYPVYGKADVIVDTEDGPHDNMVDKVIDGISAHLATIAQSNKPSSVNPIDRPSK